MQAKRPITRTPLKLTDVDTAKAERYFIDDVVHQLDKLASISDCSVDVLFRGITVGAGKQFRQGRLALLGSHPARIIRDIDETIDKLGDPGYATRCERRIERDD